MVIGKNIVSEACDISYYQGDVNFNTMKANGITVVIIRAGFGTTIDKKFITYINAAIKAGMNIGCYWFIYANGSTSSKENAKKFLEVIGPYKKYINCGLWADFEYDSDKKAGNKLSAYSRSAIVQVFNETLEASGYEVGIYSNQDYIQSGKFTAALIAKYPLWFAKYSYSAGIYANKGLHNLPYMWQYTSSGDGKKYGVSSKTLDLDHVYFNASKPSNTQTPAESVTTSPKVIKASDNPYLKPTRVLKYQYDKNRKLLYGDDVKWVQWHLWRFGLFVDKRGIPDAKQIDGYYGKDTEAAVKEAQKRLGLTVDGKVGPKTIAKFENT